MRRRLGGFGFFLVLAMLVGTGSIAAPLSPVLERGDVDQMRGERRIALVIGNGGYGPQIGALGNPTNDARDLAAALRELGFAVTLALDVDHNRMLRAVIDFGRALRDGGVGLFYYSGHALQLHGVNYLIPLDADVANEAYVPVETLPIDEVLARMGGADNRLNIVILDSCRNNPFKSVMRGTSRGLALTPAPTGTYIAYAAAPDALALDGEGQHNSPYTAALLDALSEPGLSLEDVFKRVRTRVLATTNRFQTPWTGSSITGDFFFRMLPPAAAPGASAPTAGPPPAAGAPTTDVVVWNAIQGSLDPTDFETFLETYPDSPLAPFARNRVKALQAAGMASLRSPAPKRAAGLTANVSEPSAGSAAELATAEPKEPTPEGPAVATLPPAPEPQAEQAEPVAPQSDPAAVEAELALSREQRQEVQAVLTALGHDTHGVNGIFDRDSRAALSGWQQAAGEPATGYLTEAEWVSLLATAKGALIDWRQRARPGKEFRDCADCPLMVVVQAGSYLMGSPPSEKGHTDAEGPQHRVTIREPFAVGKYEVTFAEWDACVAAGGCDGYRPDDRTWGRDRRPVIHVSWQDAKAYVAWLSSQTGKDYRLPSEAEWEYAARAGTTTPFHTGDLISTADANYDGGYTYGAGRKGEKRGRTLPVGSLAANGFGLYDVHGNVAEWVEDCWKESYKGAPIEGSWTGGDCSRRVVRGGSLLSSPTYLRAAFRSWLSTSSRNFTVGFRIARTLSWSESVAP